MVGGVKRWGGDSCSWDGGGVVCLNGNDDDLTIVNDPRDDEDNGENFVVVDVVKLEVVLMMINIMVVMKNVVAVMRWK